MCVTALLTAQNVMLEGRFSLDQPTLETGVGQDGKYYTYEGLACLLLFSLFALLSRLLNIYPHGVFVANQFIMALACVVLFRVGRQLKCSIRTSLLLSLVYGLGTMAWVHSRYLMPEPLTTLVYLTAFLFLLKYKETLGIRWLFLCGCFTGLALLVRPDAPLFVLCMVTGAGMVLFRARREQAGQWSMIAREASVFLIPLVLFFIIYVYYNYVRFGSFFESGYATKAQGTEQVETDGGSSGQNAIVKTLLGFAGMWIIPCRSVFFINPVLIFIFWAAKDFWRKYRFESIIIALILTVHVLLYSSRGPVGFSGSSAWGVRYMVPMTAFMVIAMGVFVGKIVIERHPAPVRKVFMAVFILSIVFQIIGMSSSYHVTQNYLQERIQPSDDEWAVRKMMNFDPRYNLIAMNLKWLGQYSPDFMYYSYFHQDEVNVKKYRWYHGAPAGVGISLGILMLMFAVSTSLLSRVLFPPAEAPSAGGRMVGTKNRRSG